MQLKTMDRTELCDFADIRGWNSENPLCCFDKITFEGTQRDTFIAVGRELARIEVYNEQFYCLAVLETRCKFPDSKSALSWWESVKGKIVNCTVKQLIQLGFEEV